RGSRADRRQRAGAGRGEADREAARGVDLSRIRGGAGLDLYGAPAPGSAVAAAATSDRCGLQAAQPEMAGGTTILGDQCPLRRDGGGQGLERGREGGAEGVADRLEDMPAVALDRRAQQGVVTREGNPHRIGMLVPAAG